MTEGEHGGAHEEHGGEAHEHGGHGGHMAHGHGHAHIDTHIGTHMDVFQAIYTRRSIRRFLATPIEFDKIVEVVRAGSYAPCAGNLQNWRYIVETNPDKIRSLYHHTLEQEAFLTATAAIIVVAETEIGEKFYGLRGKRLYAVQNCAAAIQNMLLASHALGLGAVWIGAFDENRINDMYRIPSTARAQAIVLMGYPDEVPQPRHMKNVWFLINFTRYGLKYQRPHLITHDLSVEWARKSADWKRASDAVSKGLKERFGGGDAHGGHGSGHAGHDEHGHGGQSGAAAAAQKAKEKAGDFFKDARERAKRMLKGLKKEQK